MKCGNCGGEQAVHETRDVQRDCRGATILAKSVTATFCPDCSEATMTVLEADAYVVKINEARATRSGAVHRA